MNAQRKHMFIGVDRPSRTSEHAARVSNIRPGMNASVKDEMKHMEKDLVTRCHALEQKLSG